VCSSDLLTPAGPVSLASGAVSVNAGLTIPPLAAPGRYVIRINTRDAAFGALVHNIEVGLTVAHFRVGIPQISQTIHAGETARFELDYVPPGGEVAGTVTFACGALPAESRCSFVPSSIPANTSSVVILSISTTVPRAALRPEEMRGTGILYAFFYFLPAAGLLWAGNGRSGWRRKQMFKVALMATLLVAMLSFMQCGGGGNSGGGAPYVAPPPSGTPSGTYTINVTARAGTFTHTIALTLVVQ